MNTRLLKELNVVYVEDDADTREQTCRAISSFFASFVACENANDALAIKTKIDVLVSDIRMPEINGIEMVEMIKKTNLPECIIFTSAHDDSEYLMKAISLKVDEYMLKPIDLTDLLERIEKNIRLKRQGRELEQSKKTIEALSVFVGGKKIEIIKHLIANADKNGNYYGSYDELMGLVDVSKPTVVATFKQLIDAELISRIRNKHYRWTAF